MALNREQLLSRRVKKQPVRCVLADGEEVLIRRPSGGDYREWKRLIRNDDGSINNERYDLNEELWIALLVVDSMGDAIFTVDDIVNGHVLDDVPLADLNTIKGAIDTLVGDREAANVISDEDIAKN